MVSELDLTDDECRARDHRLLAFCCRLSAMAISRAAAVAPTSRPQRGRRTASRRRSRLPCGSYPQRYPGWVPDLYSLDMLMCVTQTFS